MNGHEALDLAETAEAGNKQAAERLEAKRIEHERARNTQRAKFEEQMRQLEADQLAEETLLAGSGKGAANGDHAAGANGTNSAPTTPPGHEDGAAKEAVAPIGQGREMANGAKSMPASRRASGYGTFGMEKLSLSVMDEGTGRPAHWEEEEVDDQGAHNSVKYVVGDDDSFPVPKEGGKRLSAASAALDLAPLSQTPSRGYGQRPFETGLKTSDWPNFQAAPHRGMTSPLPAQQSTLDPQAQAQDASLASRKTSPTGMADSIASLPAIPSKSVPGTPFGFGGMSGAAGARTRTPNAQDSLTHAQRGYSNPDLARSFGKSGGFSALDNGAPRPYNPDPVYGAFPPNPALAPSGGGPGGFNAPGGFDPYGFDDDGYGGSGALYPGGSVGLKNKRAEADREFNRFSGVRIEDLQGELLNLCKDQHGCRYLQKKLEDGEGAHRDMIFRETYGHFPELMTDPFGNYLCQKLLEYSTDEQRTAIIESVANDLVGISLNMHGTRAVQKMVDFLASPRQPKQIRTLIYALSMNVVALIKDLNGNHVIQKCLNKLVPEDNQFIYNAIAANLIEVATHRHGCCVLQRSIDHASPSQRLQLVTEIIFNSLYLVQDPFGNYVIQYILDLNDARFSEPLIRTFIGNVCSLSVQKFSSNVVEKCIRVADPEIRKTLVGEVLNRSRLEKLLRDSYGNYVIQTILDYCDMAQRMILIECIRPILPSIRNTPYGKRIQSKLAREDSSFGYGGGGGGEHRGGYHGEHRGGRGGYREGRGGGGGYHRHLGRPQLQHVNALTEVYGSQGGPYMGPPQYGMPPHHHHHAPHPHHPGAGGHMAPTHTGMSYHAPGPDGQPWLHLRGPAGQPAPNWPVQDGANIGHLPSSNEGTPAPSVHGDPHAMDPAGVMWDQQFMPFNNGQLPPPNGHAHQAHVPMM